MTTIAYRNGVIASDSGMIILDAKVGITQKIARHPEHGLAGGAGNASWVTKFLKWHEDGQRGDPPEAQVDDEAIDRGIVVTPDAPMAIKVFEPGGMHVVTTEYYALGTGREVALGVMWKGGTARDAVKAALELDRNTFGPMRALEF